MSDRGIGAATEILKPDRASLNIHPDSGIFNLSAGRPSLSRPEIGVSFRHHQCRVLIGFGKYGLATPAINRRSARVEHTLRIFVDAVTPLEVRQRLIEHVCLRLDGCHAGCQLGQYERETALWQ